ncbi:hypothetical protein ABPG72_001435 [Tetrahymena utriculariae]
MKLQTIILVALLCSATFAANTNTCSGYFSTTCGANCQFTPDQNQTYCFSKCDGLSVNDCGNNLSCQLTTDQCLPLASDCNAIPEYDGSNVQCIQHNQECIYTPAVTCAPAQNNQCQDITLETACTGNENCSFTLKQQSCSLKDSFKCNDECSNSSLCTQQCTAKTACTGTDQAACESNGACKWDNTNNVCNDTCPSYAKCENQQCSLTCFFDIQTAKTTCTAITTEADCSANDVCQNTSTGTCAVNDGICVANSCNPDTTLCQQPSKATCNNPTCSKDIKNCGKGCFASPQVCIPNNTQQCLKSFTTQQNCESQDCRFVQLGTCSTKSSNSVIAVFTILSILIAFIV